MNFIIYSMGVIEASSDTFTTADAPLRKILNLRTCLPPFGIVAPETAQ